MTELDPDAREGSAAPLLRAVGLRKDFPGTRALDGVSLEVSAGEVLCVIGPNGAGKTTLLYTLAGMIFPSAGHVTVFGMHRWKQNFEIRKRSTVLPAEPVFGESPTPYEYLRFLAQIYGMPKAEFLERTRALAGAMGLTAHLKKEWPRLSLGMRKKTGLVGCFLPGAELRILDEPFAGGIDPLGMETLYEWIGEARGRGETIIFSTQVLDQAGDAADRIALLHEGRIAAIAPPAELIARAGIDASEPRALARAFMALTRVTKD